MFKSSLDQHIANGINVNLNILSSLFIAFTSSHIFSKLLKFSLTNEHDSHFIFGQCIASLSTKMDTSDYDKLFAKFNRQFLCYNWFHSVVVKLMKYKLLEMPIYCDYDHKNNSALRNIKLCDLILPDVFFRNVVKYILQSFDNDVSIQSLRTFLNNSSDKNKINSDEIQQIFAVCVLKALFSFVNESIDSKIQSYDREPISIAFCKLNLTITNFDENKCLTSDVCDYLTNKSNVEKSENKNKSKSDVDCDDKIKTNKNNNETQFVIEDDNSTNKDTKDALDAIMANIDKLQLINCN